MNSNIQTKGQEFSKYYKNFFSEIGQVECVKSSKSFLSLISSSTLTYHKIQILPQNSLIFSKLSKFTEICIKVRKQSLNSRIIVYDVIIGYFHLIIHLLNLERNADQQDVQVDRQNIGIGGFGAVRILNVEDFEFAVKRIKFKHITNLQIDLQRTNKIYFQHTNSIHQQIQRALRQYSIYKICSMLNIGPKVIFSNQFDLVAYQDCIQFQMELCMEPYKSHNFLFQQDISYKKYQLDLKECLLKLHLLKFVHRDIKPQNILFSQQRCKFVLADFGLTHIIKQEIDEQTLVSYSGSLKYSSKQMLQLYDSSSQGYINLYKNDLHSLNLVLEAYKQLQQQITNNSLNQLQPLARNSMSFVQSFSHNYSQQYNQQGYKQQDQQFNSNQLSSNRNSINNTGGSLLILSTNNTNTICGPMRFSSDINFYLANAIYYIFHNYYHNHAKSFILSTLQHIVHNVICLHPKDISIKQILLTQLVIMFFPQTIQSQIKINQNKTYLRNCIRIYGSQSLQVNQCIEKYIKQQTISNNFYQQSKHLKLNKNYIKQQNCQIQFTLHDSIALVKKLQIKLMIMINSYKNHLKLKQIEIIKQNQILQLMKLYIRVIIDQFQVITLYQNKKINQLIENLLVFVNNSINFQIFKKQNMVSQVLNIQLKQLQNITIYSQQMKSYQLNQQQKYLFFQQQLRQNHRTLSLMIKCYQLIVNYYQQSEFEQNNIKILSYIYSYMLKKYKGSNNKTSKFLFEYVCKIFTQLFTAKLNQYKELRLYQVQNNQTKIIYQYCYLIIKYHSESQNYQLALQYLQKIQQIVKPQAYYQDYFIHLKCSILYQLKRYQKNLILVENYISLHLDHKSQTIMDREFEEIDINHLTFDLKHTKTIHLVLMLKRWADIKFKISQNAFKQKQSQNIKQLQSQKIKQMQSQNIKKISSQNIINQKNLQIFINERRMLTSLAKVYQKSLHLLCLNFNPINYKKIFFQLINNLSVIQQKRNNIKKALGWIIHGYKYFQQKQLINSQQQLHLLCYNYLQIIIRNDYLQILVMNDQVTNQQTRQIVSYIDEIVNFQISNKIKASYKFNLFQEISSETPYNFCINFFQFHHTQQNKQDTSTILFLKNVFLTKYKQYKPFMNYNIKLMSSNLAQIYYYRNQNVKALKYFWIVCEQLLGHPLRITSCQFQFLNKFIRTLCITKSYRRAWLFIRKYIFYIPPAEYSIKKHTYTLYAEIVTVIQPLNHKLEQKCITKLIKNSFQILLSREFNLLQSIQDHFVKKVQNIFIKKLVNKF